MGARNNRKADARREFNEGRMLGRSIRHAWNRERARNKEEAENNGKV